MEDEMEEITPKYLVFDTEEEGLNRADAEGIARNYSYHRSGSGTRYYNTPVPCEDGKWALEVSVYRTLEDTETTVDTVTLLTEEEV